MESLLSLDQKKFEMKLKEDDNNGSLNIHLFSLPTLWKKKLPAAAVTGEATKNS